MTDRVTSELIFEAAEGSAGGCLPIKCRVNDHEQRLIEVRKQAHALQGNAIRLDETLARVDRRFDCIEIRLNLVDA